MERRRVASITARLLTIHFYSRALHRMTDYLVDLPADYSPARRLPVFYMLHGMPGRPVAFNLNAHVEAKLEGLIRQHRASPMILVFPDGRIGGDTETDSEWANTRAGSFESYIVDVVHDVDNRFPTLPYRQDRAIAGLSAGGYGAANVGLHQIALFGLIQAWSGYFTQTHTGVFSHATRAHLEYNSPLDYVPTMKRALASYPLRLFLYIGSHDSDRHQLAPMAAALAIVGADVHYATYPGGHDWNLWTSRIDQMLIMASRYFPTAATPSPRSEPAAHADRYRRPASQLSSCGRGARPPSLRVGSPGSGAIVAQTRNVLGPAFRSPGGRSRRNPTRQNLRRACRVSGHSPAARDASIAGRPGERRCFSVQQWARPRLAPR